MLLLLLLLLLSFFFVIIVIISSNIIIIIVIIVIKQAFLLYLTPTICHQMETFSALLALCVGNPQVTDEFPS